MLTRLMDQLLIRICPLERTGPRWPNDLDYLAL